MIELLIRARKLAVFISKYSLGNIQNQANSLIKDIDKFLYEEKLYK